jgi:hypothetical protein
MMSGAMYSCWDCAENWVIEWFLFVFGDIEYENTKHFVQKQRFLSAVLVSLNILYHGTLCHTSSHTGE